MPKKYFVTRHRGAITWAANGGVKARKVETENFDTSIVEPGDIVMGTLPVHLAAQVNARGGHYWHLSMDIPVEHRGKELSALQMAEFGARLEEFRLVGLGVRVSIAPDIARQDARTGADLHICIASGEALANYIPLAALTWGKVRIYASKTMKDQADHLKGLVEDLARKRGVPVGGICEIVSLPVKEDWHSIARFAVAESAAMCDRGISLDLNLTGGTKPMSMAFAEAFQTQARRVYCATDVGELQFLDTLNTPPQPLAPDLLDLSTYLAAQAWSINRCVVEGDDVSLTMANRQHLTASLVLSYQTLEENVDLPNFIEVVSDGYPREVIFRPRSPLRLMHHIASECAPRNQGKKNAKAFEPRVSIGFARGVPASLLDLFNELEKFDLVKDVRNQKPQIGNPNGPAIYLMSFCWTSEEACTYAAGGYLEEYVWFCLRALDLPAAHYGANVGVASYDFAKRARADSEFNEMDIAVVWKNRLLVLECKAGVQLTTGKDQDILNKLDSIKDNMGGAKGNAWLVTPLEVSEQRLEEGAKRILERAKRNRITLMHGSILVKDLTKHLARHLGVEVTQPWPDMEQVRLFKTKSKPKLKPR